MKKCTSFEEQKQALAYEVCNRMCMPLHIPKTEMCKESTLCLIQKASRCAATCTSKTATLFIFHFLYNTKILRENHVYFLFHWFSGETCIIFLFFLHKKWQTSKKLKRNMNDGIIVFLTSSCLNLKNFAFFCLSDTR